MDPLLERDFDLRLQLPNHALFVGASMSGKTRLVLKLLHNLETCFNPVPKRILFYYDQWQEEYQKLKETVESKGTEMKLLQGGGSLTLDELDKQEHQTLVVIDDASEETSSSHAIAKIATNGRHKNLSLWLIWHSLFSKHPASRIISQNVGYMFFLPSARLASQIHSLDTQLRLKGTLTESDKSANITSSYAQKLTLDRGLNTARVANFVVSGHEDAFIDTTQCYIATKFRIVDEDNSPLEGNTSVFAAPHFGNNLWSSVSISLNNTQLPPGNDYAYTALLIELLGATPNVREGVFAPLAGYASPTHSSSNVTEAQALNPAAFEDYKLVGNGSKEVTVYHRIHSDFLQSSSQLLPNKMQLGITLTRSKDAFVLCRAGESDTKEYKIDLVSVSLFVKRVIPNPAALALINKKLESGGKLFYQRLHMLAFPCPQGARLWNWHNVFNNTAPRRAFVAIVTQESYFGNYGRLSTYLESAGVSRIRFCLDGREILAEPYTCDFKYTAPGVVDWEASDAKQAFAGLNQTLDVFATPRQHVGIRYSEFTNGSTLFGLSLAHHEGLSTVQGSLDIHIDFEKASDVPLMILVLGEYPKSMSFDQSRNIVEM